MYKNYQKGRIIFDNDRGYCETVLQVNRFLAVIQCTQAGRVVVSTFYRIEYIDCIALMRKAHRIANSLDDVLEMLTAIYPAIIEDRKVALRVSRDGMTFVGVPYRRYSPSDLITVIGNGGEVVDAATSAAITEDDLNTLISRKD